MYRIVTTRDSYLLGDDEVFGHPAHVMAFIYAEWGEKYGAGLGVTRERPTGAPQEVIAYINPAHVVSVEEID